MLDLQPALKEQTFDTEIPREVDRVPIADVAATAMLISKTTWLYLQQVGVADKQGDTTHEKWRRIHCRVSENAGTG